MTLTPKERKELTKFQKELTRRRPLGFRGPTPGTPGKFDDNPGWYSTPTRKKKAKT